MKKLILIDGNAIIHRAFHAIPPFMRNSKGELVNAVFGFTSMLLNILQNEKPDFIAVSFDMKGKTFRHEQYDGYKATRVKAKDELYAQIPKIREIVESFEIPIYEKEGFEADDVLGTLAAQMDKKGDIETYIVTGDMDTMQLVSERTKVLCPIKGFNQTEIYDVNKVHEKYSLSPEQIVDFKGLVGDPSDNLKGVPGIGKKTATDLLMKYGNIENIYAHLEEITGKLREKLEQGKESGLQSKYLATIVKNVPVELNLQAARTHEYQLHKIRELFEDLEFRTLLPRLAALDRFYSEKKSSENDLQTSLF